MRFAPMKGRCAMDQDQYDEIERMKQQLDLEYEEVRFRLQAILNYRGLNVPGNVRIAALRRAQNMREFLDDLVDGLTKK